MSRISCALTANFATAAVLSDAALIWPWNAHMSECLRCQAYMASVRATRRRLGEMRTESAKPPSGFDPSLFLTLDPQVIANRAIANTSIAKKSAQIPGGGAASRQMATVSAAIAAAALAAAWIWRRAQAKSV